MKHDSEDKVVQGDTEENVNCASNNNKIKVRIDKDSNALQDAPKDDVDSEKGKVTMDVGSEVMAKEVVQKRNRNKQKEPPQRNGQEQPHKNQSNEADHNRDLSTNQTARESSYPELKGDWSRSFSSTSVQTKIFLGPGEVVGTYPWNQNSNFDNLKFRILPISTGSERLEYCQLVEKFGKLGSIPETAFVDGNSYVRDQQATHRKVTHDAFMKSRLATLRKTPATIVLPKPLSAEEQEKGSFSSKDSVLDLVVGEVRMDEVYVGAPRFDPYHSECGQDCRKCFFLTQTQNPPHLTPKIMKVAKNVDNATSSKSQRKKCGFGSPFSK